MEKKNNLVVFNVDEQQFAIHLSTVESVLPALEIQVLPMAPEYILGTINFQGDFLPVVNLRKLFLLPQREVEINDQLILVMSQDLRVALWVDMVCELVDRAGQEISKADKILLDVGHVEGLFKLNDGMVLIHDLDKFLTPEQTSRLSKALEEQRKTLDERRKKKDDVGTRPTSSKGQRKQKHAKSEPERSGTLQSQIRKRKDEKK